MKSPKMFALGVIITAILITSSIVFAEKTINNTSNTNSNQLMQKSDKIDPIQRLEKMKSDIQQKLTSSKITKEKADKAIERIDKKIKEIQDFNKLTTPQKKDKLLNDFTAAMKDKVKNGKIDQTKADKAIADFKTKLDQWDGSGMPFLKAKGFKGFHGDSHIGKSGKFQDALDKAVKDGKITKQQQTDILDNLNQ